MRGRTRNRSSALSFGEVTCPTNIFFPYVHSQEQTTRVEMLVADRCLVLYCSQTTSQAFKSPLTLLQPCEVGIIILTFVGGTGAESDLLKDTVYMGGTCVQTF